MKTQGWVPGREPVEIERKLEVGGEPWVLTWDQILLQVLARGLWGQESVAVSLFLKVKAGPWQPE